MMEQALSAWGIAPEYWNNGMMEGWKDGRTAGRKAENEGLRTEQDMQGVSREGARATGGHGKVQSAKCEMKNEEEREWWNDGEDARRREEKNDGSIE
jgi:hypothetical protein